MKRLLILLLVVAVAGGAYAIYRNYNSAPSDKIRVSGNIELEEVNIAFKTSGKLIERTVDEGDNVTKGEVIARLDKDQLLRQRDREVATLAEDEAQLAQSRTSLEMQTESTSADLDSRKADLTSYQSKLDELKAGSRPQELAEAAASTAAAEAEYQRAKSDWDRSQQLHKDDDISTSQYEQSKKAFDSAQANLDQARQHEALLKEGSRKEDLDQAQAQVIHAKANVRGGEANVLNVKRSQEDIAAKEAEIDREKAQIALIDSQLADTTAISPINGVVLVKSTDVGEVIAPGTSVVTVGDLDHPWLRAYIKEPDLSRVKIGAHVTVRTDAAAGKTFNGRVAFISSEAEFTPKQIQTTEERVKLVYRIKIDIDNPQHELKANMPADADIDVAK
jgi:HlyD family secretion protein